MKKQWIVMLAVSGIVMFLSCKEKKIAAVGSPPDCGTGTTYNHFYKVYSGTLSGISSGPASTIWGECIFNNESHPKLYFRNTSTANQVGSTTPKLYYYLNMNSSDKPGIRKNDSIYLFLKNYSLTTGHIESDKDAFGITAPKHKGSLGCFPGFIINSSGMIDSFKTSQGLYITLPFARHIAEKEIYDTLEGYDFLISSLELKRLNDSVAKYPDLQGGIDKTKRNILKVYKANDELLGCFGEE